MYKVFINEKLIYFANKNETLGRKSNCLIINFYQEDLALFIVDLLKNDAKVDSVIVKVDKPEKAFELFKQKFKLITAAGGLVRNKDNKWLLIHRLNKWDLPKGKIEKEETVADCAIREVEEECGISGVKIINPLPDTFHIYNLNDELILKHTHWFEMNSDFIGELKPQIEENITEVSWMSKNEIQEKVYSNTYASIKELLINYF